MPLHAVCSTVRPASFLYGAGGGYGGPNQMSFPAYAYTVAALLLHANVRVDGLVKTPSRTNSTGS